MAQCTSVVEFGVFVFLFLNFFPIWVIVDVWVFAPVYPQRTPELQPCCAVPREAAGKLPRNIFFVDNSSPFSTILPHKSVNKPDDLCLPHPTNTWINSSLTGCRRDWPTKHLRPAASVRAPCRAACWVPCCTLFTRMIAPLLTTPTS